MCMCRAEAAAGGDREGAPSPNRARHGVCVMYVAQRPTQHAHNTTQPQTYAQRAAEEKVPMGSSVGLEFGVGLECDKSATSVGLAWD